jgi:polyferredoxin/Pyruvate/2-oxoacid:ferredoxin oxidoreductase delta subunit
MRIITTRRISQIFFFTLFIWLGVVATVGERFWQLRGWPINWFLQLDPLSGLGLLLATHTIYAGLLWGVVTLALTLFLGRFFCGWLCPFGTWQQFMGYLGKRGLPTSAKIARNRPHPAQRVKYWLLAALLAAAAADLILWLLTAILQRPIGPQDSWLVASLQTGLLDPIVLMHRSFNLVILALIEGRIYPGAMLIGALFLLFTLLCLWVPRFYCRFVCPLGALLGLLSRWSIWRIGKKENRCADCRLCEKDCEGACAPAGTIRVSECVLCMNCLDACRHDLIGYRPQPSAAGQHETPDWTRRQVVASLAAGLVAAPMLRLDGAAAAGWNPEVVRPPGALAEADFLARCLKCSQCMRVCPTQVIRPAGLQSGFEGLWTPMLDFRVGSSGCQHNCVACSTVCPTAALRPLSVDERLGRGAFAQAGPLRLGMAFVDHGRCLPWAMDTPCIVCQENCPVSPKAIFTREVWQPVRDGRHRVQAVAASRVVLAAALIPGRYGTGDYFCRSEDREPVAIAANDAEALILTSGAAEHMPVAGGTLEILIRLQQPYVDPGRCIGCGVCEHECPVQGRRAIRVTAENESRQRNHRLVLA